MTKTYLFHELSSIFPLIEGEEFDALVEDIKKKGQLEPGILFEGKILDGRNRYRACKLLNIPFKTLDFSNKVSARDYIVSTNLHRRHLTTAQRSEIGLILLEEEEKLAKERMSEIGKLRTEEGKKGFKEITNMKDLSEKLDSEKVGEKGTSVEKIAPQVKVSSTTLTKAKKIKEVSKSEPMIAKEWEKAKKGDTSVDAVYKKAKIIEKLPNDVKKEATKVNPKITLAQAQKIAEFPKPEQRKVILKEIEKSKDKTEKIIDAQKKMASVEDKLILQKEDIDKKQIDLTTDIWLKISREYRDENLKQFNESTQKECVSIMDKAGKFILNEVSKYRTRHPNP